MTQLAQVLALKKPPTLKSLKLANEEIFNKLASQKKKFTLTPDKKGWYYLLLDVLTPGATRKVIYDIDPEKLTLKERPKRNLPEPKKARARET